MKRIVLAAAITLFASIAHAGWPYRSSSFAEYQASKSAYMSAYHAPSAYVNGGFVGPGFYMPYSYTVTPTYNGAIYQGNGGNLWWGGYSPYSYGGYVPNYYPAPYGYGFGMY
ncbi:MAG: hypothetical protein KGL39_42575 [Patescibacteria group bacterium]|nr:hypothetical protein [Patescibacteria group bacterium]